MAFDFESLLAGPSEKDKQAALTQGLLAAGLGMLSNNRSKNAGMAIGQGGLLGLQAYQGSLGQSRQEAMQRLQMAMMADKVRKEREAEERYRSLLSGTSPEQALAMGAAEGDVGPTQTNANRIGQSAIPGMDMGALRAADMAGGRTLVGKMLEDHFKTPEALKLINQLQTPEQRQAALQAKAGILPQISQFDAGGTFGTQAYDPVTQTVRRIAEQQKTPAPGAIPFELSGMNPEQARAYNLQRAAAGASRMTSIGSIGPRAFETELGKIDADQLKDWRNAALTAQSTLSTVANLREAVRRGVYSGGLANVKTEVANLIGGITGTSPTNLPGSQLFDAEASKLVLDHIKTLGANPSNADREFINKTVPRLSSSPEARDELISYLEQKAQAAISRFEQADKYARAKGGLGGFNVIQQPTVEMRFDSSGRLIP